MKAALTSLEQLLDPIDVGTFWHEHWERTPLHVTRPGFGGYDGLLSITDVDELLAYNNRADVPRLSVANRGPLAPQFGQDTHAQAVDAYYQGSTLFLGSLHQRWPAIARLCRSVESELRHPVGATAVLSPGGAQGLSIHYDGAEVFCLQLEGEKSWQIFDPIDPLPLDGSPLTGFDPAGRASTTVHLKAGDLLYVPRGLPHQAFTSESPSLHLSLYVNVIRWKDLLAQVVAEVAARHIEMRQSLPVGSLGEDVDAALRAGLASRLRTLVDDARPEAALSAMLANLISQMEPVPRGSFERVGRLDEIGLDTILEKLPGSICQVRAGAAGQVEIAFPGGAVSGPAFLETAMRTVATAARFAVRDLSMKNEDNKIVLCRRLVREGLLRVVGRAG